MKQIYKRTITSWSLYCFFLLVTSCPGEEDCFDIANIARVDDLITLLPEQTEYNQGDVVILKLEIPATNSYFGDEINLYQETEDNSAFLALSFNQLFTENQLNFIRGISANSNSNNWFNVIYNENNDMYELEIEITLNKSGAYSMITSDFIEFDGGDCNRYRLDTNVLWQGDAVVGFTVIE
ncbi:MAG: hypothetical protein AAF901_09935 [Bacteroidota bacterium]